MRAVLRSARWLLPTLLLAQGCDTGEEDEPGKTEQRDGEDERKKARRPHVSPVSVMWCARAGEHTLAAGRAFRTQESRVRGKEQGCS